MIWKIFTDKPERKRSGQSFDNELNGLIQLVLIKLIFINNFNDNSTKSVSRNARLK